MSAAPQPLQYFGRAFSITVTPQGGGPAYTIASTATTPQLRVTFSIETRMWQQSAAGQPIFEATITIYNLGKSATSQIASGSATASMTQALAAGQPLSLTQSITMGDVVTISAGYQQSASGVFSAATNLLFTGNLMQPISTRENVTDTKLILKCVANLAAQSFAFASVPIPSGSTDWTTIQQMNTSMGLPSINSKNIDSASMTALQGTQYFRAQSVFDRPLNVISSICKQHRLLYWIAGDGLHIGGLTALGKAPTQADFSYGPPNLSSYSGSTTSTNTGITKTTLIGYPEGTQDGVIFRVLMDNQVQLGSSVQIAGGTAINTFQFNYGTSYPPLPNSQGIYQVFGLRHFGDSRGRGEDWYTEITGMTPAWFSGIATLLGSN
jgi:hypothetical protein